MAVNENTVLYSLLLGIIPGVFLTFSSALKNKYKDKKYFLFIPDFMFAFSFFVVTYIGSIPLTYGRVRILQVLLELVSMLTTLFVFEPMVSFLVFLPKKIKNNQIKFIKKKVNQ